MRKTALILLALAAATPAMAGEMRRGAKLDAITSGRLYDRILTPQLNPGYHLDHQAEQQLFDDIRAGRTDLNSIPEEQRHYFQLQMDSGR